MNGTANTEVASKESKAYCTMGNLEYESVSLLSDGSVSVRRRVVIAILSTAVVYVMVAVLVLLQWEVLCRWGLVDRLDRLRRSYDLIVILLVAFAIGLSLRSRTRLTVLILKLFVYSVIGVSIVSACIVLSRR
jgi:hypothetical protein